MIELNLALIATSISKFGYSVDELSRSSNIGSVTNNKVRIFFKLNSETNKYELCARIGDLTTVLATGR